jgi:menaquinol-cytochrome c reductase cytochrome b subunit
MKIPTPPLPRSLRRRPPRPGSAPARDGAGVNGPDGRPAAKQPSPLVEGGKEAGISTLGWLDERTGTSPFLRAFLFRKVPKGTNWFYTLGSATMFAFVSQAVTGVFLAMYYDPSPTRAYESTQHITNEVFLGELVRGMHKWGATLMVILIFLHMARTFFFGAYKYPRELNWVIGVVLLVLTLLMGLTGYLLPFDQRSFWATVVAVNINASGPILGPYLADFLRGGAEFEAITLSRFYAMHMLLIPGLIAALIGAHLYLVAKLGTTAPPWLKAEKDRALAKEDI